MAANSLELAPPLFTMLPNAKKGEAQLLAKLGKSESMAAADHGNSRF
jgi:hypothetical protein